jgi:hypothetical protein
VYLFPHLINTLKKHFPLVQIEISGEENRQKMFEILIPLGYQVYKLQNENLVQISVAEAMGYEGGDFYFKR